MPESVVLLHGFSGTGRAWDGVAARLRREGYRPLVPDLPGHGPLGTQHGPVTFGACTQSVLERAPQRFLLCGYSLGGRVALHVALAAPERVSALVLISASAGIEGAAERAERRRADGMLADALEREPFEEFLARWASQPLFAEDPPHVRALARDDQLRNDPHALAAVLRGVGTGAMEPLWAKLPLLAMPLTVLAGERDHKFQALGRRIATLAPDAALIVVPGGHRLALENPERVAEVLSQRLHAEAGGGR